VPFDVPVSHPASDVATNRLRAGGGRTYLLLLDDLHTHPLRTDEVRGIARLFIEGNLAANDLAAIAVTSGIEPSQPLTSNRQRLLEAADRFIGRDHEDAPGLSLSADNPFADFAVDPLPGFGVLDRAKEIKARKVRQLLRTLETAAEWLAGTESRRKAVVLVSQGLDYDTTDLFGDREALLLLDEMRQAASAVTRHDVTLYAIDPRGLPSAEPGPIPTRWLVGETPFSPPIVRAKQTLRGLAEETGGFAFINSNQFDAALENVVRQNSTYYLLGYRAPRDAPDDQLHQIRVRVDRPDVEVRARRSYVHAAGPAGDAEPRVGGARHQRAGDRHASGSAGADDTV
jgi:VWFA-related protein